MLKLGESRGGEIVRKPIRRVGCERRRRHTLNLHLKALQVGGSDKRGLLLRTASAAIRRRRNRAGHNLKLREAFYRRERRADEIGGGAYGARATHAVLRESCRDETH